MKSSFLLLCIFRHACWLLCLFATCSVNASPTDTCCPTLPPLSIALEAANKDGFDLGFMGQGRAKYDKNSHGRTLSEWVERDPFRIISSIDKEFRDCRVFPYLVDSVATKDHTLIPIPRDYFWCLLRPGTIVLLTDGVTHHFTMVYSVNRIHEYLDLIDWWPDQIFLRRGLNRKRVEAKIVEVPKKGKLVRITRNEFDRVVLGAIGHENVSFHAHLAEVFGESRNNPRFLLALAIATLGPEPHESTESALPYLEKALNVVRPETGTALARRIALKSLYVVHVTSYLLESGYVSESNRETVTHSLRRIVRIIRELFKDIQVESSLSEKQLVRLGQLALNANESHESEHIFSTVIQRFPNNPEGYFGRAMARYKLMKYNGTIEDVTRALPLREKLLASGAVPMELKEDSSGDESIEYLRSGLKRKHLHFMLTESYFLRGTAYNYLGKYEEAELDGRAAVEIKPNDPKGYFVTALSLYERGLYWEAVPYFIKASNCARKPLFTIVFYGMAKKTLDSAKQHNPCRTLGFLKSKNTPFVPILKDWAAAEAFLGEERAESDGEKLKRLSSCFVPNGTPAISMGEEHGEFIEVLIDRTLAGEQLINQGQQEHDFYCKGVVLKFMLHIFDDGDQKK